MKTKIVYVLVSTEKDYYLEQAYVSMRSAKYHNPDAHVTLLVDKLTEESFVGRRREMADCADEIVAVDLDRKLSGMKRSRLLKTGVRLYVDGDFLFIDTDTIIAKSLADIDNIPYEMAACKDTHADFVDNPYRDMCINHLRILGLDIKQEKTYFNSGVIYVKDTPNTRKFYQLWNQNYLESYDKKVSMDQPSFCKTNIEMGHFINILDDVWNCELKHGIKFLKDAKVVHYLGTNKVVGELAPLFIMNDINALKSIRESNEISVEVMAAIKDPFAGLASVTHCFAGRDVFFFRKDAFSYLRDLYYKHPGLFANVNTVVHLCIRFKAGVGKLRRIFMGGVNRNSQVVVLQLFEERRAA